MKGPPFGNAARKSMVLWLQIHLHPYEFGGFGLNWVTANNFAPENCWVGRRSGLFFGGLSAYFRMGEVLVSGSVGHLFGVEGWCFKHIAEAVGWIQFDSAVVLT